MAAEPEYRYKILQFGQPTKVGDGDLCVYRMETTVIESHPTTPLEIAATMQHCVIAASAEDAAEKVKAAALKDFKAAKRN